MTMSQNHPLRILIIAPQPFYQDRGTPIAVRLLTEELAALGHRVDLLVYHEGEDIVIPGASIHRSPGASYLNNIPPGFSWKKIMSDFQLYSKAKKLIKDNDYDVLHCVEEAVFMATRFKKRYDVPYIYDMDSSLSVQLVDKMPYLGAFRSLFEWFEKGAVSGSDGVLAVCPALADQALALSPETHVVCLEDINLNEETVPGDEDLRAAFGIEEPLLLYVGNLEGYQGIDLLLDSISALKARDVPAHLVIIGGNEQTIIPYRQLTEKFGIDSMVTFCGPRDISLLGYYLEQADILVSPRIRGNNTPMKIYSYLGSGRAVLATDLPTHTQVLTRDVAWLSEPDGSSMANGLQYLIENPEIRNQLGKQGKKLVDENYSRDSYVKKLGAFYEKLRENLPARSAPPPAC